MAGEATGRLQSCSQWPDSGFIRTVTSSHPRLEEPTHAAMTTTSVGWPVARKDVVGAGPSALLSVSAAAVSRGLLDHHLGPTSMHFNRLVATKQEPLVPAPFSPAFGTSTGTLSDDASGKVPSFDDGQSANSRDRGKQHLSPCVPTSNGGSLVLDVSKGELINLAKLTPQEILDAKALAASKSHSEAERRRRERINTHLATLRSNLPSSTKTDKASLLGEVIDHLKDLKRQAADIAEGGPVPSEVDELTVDIEPSCGEGGESQVCYRASICCDDRPDLYQELMKALHLFRLQTVRAEIATLGGRIKNVLIVTRADGEDEADTKAPTVASVLDALKVVIDSAGDQSPGASKRQRLASLDTSSPSQ